jgi:threonine/homoserine/homoserine lactone efflux protein
MVETMTSPWLSPTLLTLAAAATPGPNNLLIVQAVAQRGAPGFTSVSLGVLAGGVTMLLLLSCFADLVGHALDGARRAISILGSAYLMLLALRLWRASAPAKASAARPQAKVGVVEVAMLQWINPKGWALLAVLVASGKGMTGQVLGTVELVVVFVGVSGLCMSAWGLFGSWLHGLDAAHPMRPIADRVMALTLAACACDMVLRT